MLGSVNWTFIVLILNVDYRIEDSSNHGLPIFVLWYHWHTRKRLLIIFEQWVLMNFNWLTGNYRRLIDWLKFCKIITRLPAPLSLPFVIIGVSVCMFCQDPRVLDAMLPYQLTQFGNPHSRTHAYGWESEAAVEKARQVLLMLWWKYHLVHSYHLNGLFVPMANNAHWTGHRISVTI